MMLQHTTYCNVRQATKNITSENRVTNNTPNVFVITNKTAAALRICSMKLCVSL